MFCIGLFGLDATTVHPTSVTSDIQATCQLNSTIISSHTEMHPTNIITSSVSLNTTFSTTPDSPPLAVIAASIAGGILGLCVIFVGLIITIKRKQSKVKRSIMTMPSSTSTFNRYVV